MDEEVLVDNFSLVMHSPLINRRFGEALGWSVNRLRWSASNPQLPGPFSVRKGTWRTRANASLTFHSITSPWTGLLHGQCRKDSKTLRPGKAIVKDQETIAQFIHLRAQDLSFDKIAAQLKVSKPTLITWSRKFQFDIQNLRAIETEALAEKCFAARQQRWEQISRDLGRVEAELAKRDLSDVPTASLLAQAARLRDEVRREVGNVRFSIPVRHLPSEEYFEDVLDWQV